MPRKAHTKSRYGCDNCRRRRVKCDEQGPPCTNCILRQLQNCKYSRVLPANLIANARRASNQLPGSPSSPLSRPPPVAIANNHASAHAHTTGLAQPQTSGSSNGLSSDDQGPHSPRTFQPVDQLELMHQFATVTYKSLCVSDSEKHTWQTLVPRLGLRHRYIMNGILALASLHIATTLDSSSSVRARYVDTGLEYHSMSLEPFRLAIANLSEDNCDAAFAQSIVTTAFSLAYTQFISRDNPRMTENIIQVFELLQGVKKILTLGQSWINLELFLHGPFWENISAALDEDTASAMNQLVALNERLHVEQGDGPDRIHQEVIDRLRHCFMKFSVSPDPAPVLGWLAAVDKGFIESLRQRMPFSLLILAYWGVLLAGLDGQRWWARGSGRALVSELLETLRGAQEDPLWEDCVGWVRRKSLNHAT